MLRQLQRPTYLCRRLFDDISGALPGPSRWGKDCAKSGQVAMAENISKTVPLMRLGHSTQVSSVTYTRDTDLLRLATRRTPAGNRSYPPKVVVGHVRSFA